MQQGQALGCRLPGRQGRGVKLDAWSLVRAAPRATRLTSQASSHGATVQAVTNAITNTNPFSVLRDYEPKLRPAPPSNSASVPSPPPPPALAANPDNWQFNRSEFLSLNRQYGPFEIDACADAAGLNAHCTAFFSPANSFLTAHVAGKAIWLHPPRSQARAFIMHYVAAKAADTTTSGMFILPEQTSAKWWPLVEGFVLIKRYSAGTHLFTVPSAVPSQPNHQLGPITKPVVVLYDPPVYSQAAAIHLLRNSPAPAPPPGLITPGAAAMPPATATTTQPPVTQPPMPPAHAASSAHIAALADSRYNSSAAHHQNASVLITVPCTIRNHEAQVLIDGGSQVDAIHPELVRKVGGRIIPAPRQVTFADGHSGSSPGTFTGTITVGSYKVSRSFLVTELSHDVILGKPWLTDTNPHVDWRANVVIVSDGWRLHRLATPPSAASDASPQVPVISALQARRAHRRGATVFVGLVRDAAVDSDTSTAPAGAGIPGLDLSHIADPAYQAEVDALVRKYSHLFAKPSGLPPSRPGVDFKIELEPGAKPPVRPTYRMSVAELQEVRKQLEELTELGFIRPSTSPYGAPILFVRKKDGTLRMCIDYRALNKITVKNRYPLPRIDELLDQLHGSTIWTSLDCASGYHQVRLHSDSISKTAFRTRYGSFEFLVLPFGLTNAPSAFMAWMHDILRPFIDKFVVCFLDDILIASRTPAEHLTHLEQVFQALSANKVLLKASKCHIATSHVDFLGHTLTPQGIAVDQRKVAAVQQWPRPGNVHDVRSFCGLVGFYRRFISGFSRLAAPLTELTKASQPWRWASEQQHAFESLKAALTSAPVLLVPDMDKPFHVFADASQQAIGAVLMQDQGRGLQPVAFESRKLTPAERNYPIHEIELLAVVHALKVWRCYLEGTQFYTNTDHQSLQYLMTQPHLSRRQARWVEFLQQFDTHIAYLPGEKNPADPLSRRPDLMINAVSTVRAVSDFLSAVRVGYPADPAFTSEQATTTYQLVDGLYYHKSRLVIPAVPALREQLLHEHHDVATAGHLGVDKTLAALQRLFYWPGMHASVREYVTTCDSCQRNKPSHALKAGKLQPLPPPTSPWESISMDFITGLPATAAGYDAILTFVDRFSKQSHFIPTTTTCSAVDTAALFLREVYRHHGLPTSIVSDRDARFTSHFWQTVFRHLGTDLKMSTAFHPETDGQSERANRTIEEMLRHYVHPLHDDWDRYLPILEFAYNNSVNPSTHHTPFFLNTGRHPLTPASYALASRVPAADDYMAALATAHQAASAAIQLAQARQKSAADRRRRELSFQVGDHVLLNTRNLELLGVRKFTARCIGPFRVTAVVSPVAYKLALPASMRVHPVFHVSLLQPHRTSEAFPARQAAVRPPPVAADAKGELWEVEAILDKRRGPQWLVRWKGYGPDSDSWEPRSSFDQCPELLDEFESHHAARPTPKRSRRRR